MIRAVSYTHLVRDELEFMKNLRLEGSMAMVAEQIVKEIKSRLQFLTDVGLSYLTLSRSAGTLSGGESQRIRLATQIGSSLMGVLYILDEPSIGLHPVSYTHLDVYKRQAESRFSATSVRFFSGR